MFPAALPAGPVAGRRPPSATHLRGPRPGRAVVLSSMTRAGSTDAHYQHLAALHAVLSATNEAVLRCATERDLFREVCAAAMADGYFLIVSISLRQGPAGALRTVAAAGVEPHTMDALGLAVEGDSVQSGGMAGTAFRTGLPSVSNDLYNDARMQRVPAWRESIVRRRLGSGAAVPLVSRRGAIGVLMFFAERQGAFDAETVRLIERMARNIAFALDKFDEESERRSAEEALRASERRHAILESIQDAYYEVDLAGNHMFCTTAFTRLLGYSRDEVLAGTNRAFQTDAMARQVGAIFKQVWRSGVACEREEWQYLHRDGRVLSVEGSVHLLRDAEGRPRGFHGILRDITQQRAVELALRESEARFRALTHLSSDWYWELDTRLHYRAMEGRRHETAAVQQVYLGRPVWDAELSVDLPGGWGPLREKLEAQAPFRDVPMFRSLPDGRPYFVSVSGEPMFGADGAFAGYRGVSHEITRMKLAESRAQHLATHDTLTGLPNRAHFGTLLGRTLKVAAEGQAGCAVLFIDLDRFKFVNDTLGHAAGDQLLQELAGRFRQVLPPGGVLARLAGDEFVVLLPTDDPAAVGEIAQALLGQASRPVWISGSECSVSASVGVARSPADGRDEQTLMKNADAAMYSAKDRGKNNMQFYSSEIQVRSIERLALETGLRQVLVRHELAVHYQAKLSCGTQGVVGVEALLRWTSPELGEVPPARFIPLAEETGLIVAIGRWVLHEACRQSVAWQRQGLPAVCMAVNVSARQLDHVDFVADLASVLQETGLEPCWLELELTESVVIRDPERALALLREVKALGVRLAIDDFGAGYSALGQLRHFPVDTIKIDQSFIQELATSAEDKAITRAIITIGRALGLTVVAEGVETAEQEHFLRSNACDQMQGFHFSRPVEAAAFAALMGLGAAVPARQAAAP